MFEKTKYVVLGLVAVISLAELAHAGAWGGPRSQATTVIAVATGQQQRPEFEIWQVQRAVAIKEYQVEYRHPTETDNKWRVSVGWTTNYKYAKGVYDYLVKLKKYEVRMYERTRNAV